MRETPVNNNFENMLSSFPKMYRNKAAGLMQYLTRDEDITWDDQGHVSIGEKKIPDTHIVDLIHDAMRLRKNVARAQGWRVLSKYLAEKNVPKEFLGNPDWADPEWYTPPSSPYKKKPSSPLPHKTETPLKKLLKRLSVPYKLRQAKLKARKTIKDWTRLQDG